MPEVRWKDSIAIYGISKGKGRGSRVGRGSRSDLSVMDGIGSVFLGQGRIYAGFIWPSSSRSGQREAHGGDCGICPTRGLCMGKSTTLNFHLIFDSCHFLPKTSSGMLSVPLRVSMSSGLSKEMRLGCHTKAKTRAKPSAQAAEDGRRVVGLRNDGLSIMSNFGFGLVRGWLEARNWDP